jgi:hyperosmotically inducible periplasmic protein
MLKRKLMFTVLSALMLMTGVTFATANTTATSTSKTNQSTYQKSKGYVSDATITAKVKSELLLNKHVKSLSISVATNDGIVTLSGIVNNPLQKREALRTAHKITGVKSIKDELVVSKTQ